MEIDVPIFFKKELEDTVGNYVFLHVFENRVNYFLDQQFLASIQNERYTSRAIITSAESVKGRTFLPQCVMDIQSTVGNHASTHLFESHMILPHAASVWIVAKKKK